MAFCAQKRAASRIPSRQGCIRSTVVKMEDSNEELVWQFITELDLDYVTNKRVYLCPSCGKMLSGLTSYQRHLVSFGFEYN